MGIVGFEPATSWWPSNMTVIFNTTEKLYPFTIFNKLFFIWKSNFDNQFEKIEQASPGFIFDLVQFGSTLDFDIRIKCIFRVLVRAIFRKEKRN